jgi:hypothetical protein
MNRILADYYPIFTLYQALRVQLLDQITDEDLLFQPGGENPTLGALCRDLGDVQHAYVESFRTFICDFSARTSAAESETSVAHLRAWYATLDDDLRSAIERLSDHDLNHRTIDRGGDFRLPPQLQLDVYKEALLIFYGKVSVYLKVMERPLSKQWVEWIG